MKKIIKFCSIIMVLVGSFVGNIAYSIYDSNHDGVVAQVLTYTNQDKILFRMENQPSTHPLCQTAYFAIASDVPIERRKASLSMLMASWLSGKQIRIGFDGQGDCAHGYIRVHRVG